MDNRAVIAVAATAMLLLTAGCTGLPYDRAVEDPDTVSGADTTETERASDPVGTEAADATSTPTAAGTETAATDGGAVTQSGVETDTAPTATSSPPATPTDTPDATPGSATATATATPAPTDSASGGASDTGSDDSTNDDVQTKNVTVDASDSYHGGQVDADELVVQSEGNAPKEFHERVEPGGHVDLPEGRYDINISAEGYEPTVLKNHNVQEDDQEITVELDRHYEEYNVTFQVTDSNGDAIQSGQVELTDMEPHLPRDREDRVDQIEAGEAMLTVNEGEIRVEITSDGYEPAEHTYDVQEDMTVDVTLEEDEDADGSGG